MVNPKKTEKMNVYQGLDIELSWTKSGFVCREEEKNGIGLATRSVRWAMVKTNSSSKVPQRIEELIRNTALYLHLTAPPFLRFYYRLVLYFWETVAY